MALDTKYNTPEKILEVIQETAKASHPEISPILTMDSIITDFIESLDVYYLVAEMELYYGVSLSEKEISTIKTVKDLVFLTYKKVYVYDENRGANSIGVK